MLILVGGTVLGVLRGIITPQILGTVTGLSTGGGILGLGLILYFIIRRTLP